MSQTTLYLANASHTVRLVQTIHVSEIVIERLHLELE